MIIYIILNLIFIILSIIFIETGIDKNIIQYTISGIILEFASIICIMIICCIDDDRPTYTIPVARVVDESEAENKHIVIGIPL
jgi:hypothetical protein